MDAGCDVRGIRQDRLAVLVMHPTARSEHPGRNVVVRALVTGEDGNGPLDMFLGSGPSEGAAWRAAREMLAQGCMGDMVASVPG